MTALWVTLALATLVALGARAYRSLHMLQLEGYRPERWLRHSVERISWREVGPIVAYLATLALGAVLVAARVPGAGWVLLGIALAETIVLAWLVFSRPAKKPIAWTARMLRLTGMTALVSLVACGAVAWTLAASGAGALALAGAVLVAYAGGGLLVVCAPLFVLAALSLAEPVEAAVRRGYISAAHERLATVKPLVIGVTGSYGKTTTKNALAAALSGRYKVLASPESYNTLLGVVRTINEQLADDTEVFIVEMGARQTGDIAEICALVHPTVGIITRLGPQHLEYFKTEENVVRTKSELLCSLPAEGFAVLDADGLTDFAQPDGWSVRALRVSAREDAQPDALLADVTVGRDGTTFTLVREGREGFSATTPLLGRHAAINCSLAALAALELGVTPDMVREGLRSMAPVQHRLEIVRNDSVVVIDDAFNSNPDGFSAALEVLGSISGRHILVTPGMIELGEATVPAHERVAKAAAAVCDVVILVGKTAPAEFADTMVASGLPAERLIRTATLTEATEALGHLIAAGDVVLFENDLPDNFA